MNNPANSDSPDGDNLIKGDRPEDSKQLLLSGAEEAALTNEELEEMSKAKNALSFLERVRLDLADLDISNDNRPGLQAYDSTQTQQDTLTDQKPINAAIGESFGRFTILETIGQGGFARVFRAHDPVLDREVALKIPRPQALVSNESASRFQREAKAAAMLSHPAIVPVFESGNVGPISFIASGYCQGETLAAWFKNQNRQVDQRTAAAIIARLAEAVEHAHQRGIVHRDLKPANILIDHSDPDSNIAQRLRITDFGLAKHIDAADDSLTLEGAVVGTPAYMSPEQASGSQETAAATDIYSLGVILFELLSSQLPFNKNTHLEMLKAVENEEPPVLSRIDKAIPRDLSAITQKCLSKNPVRRYATAYDLASDLQAWLESRPVKARPVSAIRRMYQWYTRNTALACALTFAFLSLAIGLGVSLWQWNVADANATRADEQLIMTTEANKQSQDRLTQIEDSMHALTGIFDDLDIAKVEQSAEPLQAVLAGRLIYVGKRLDAGLVDDRLVEADLKSRLAASLIALGFASDAIPLAKFSRDTHLEMLGEDNLKTADSLSLLGNAFYGSGKYQEALESHQHALAIKTVKLPENDPSTLGNMGQVAGDFLRLGEYPQAIAQYQLTLALKELVLDARDPAIFTSMSNLASAYMANGQNDEAQPLFEKALRLRKQELVPDHPDTLQTMDQLARCLLKQKKVDEALPLLKETLNRREAALGPTHPWTLTSISSLASGYRADEQYEKSLPLFEKVLELRKVRLGEEDPMTIASINDLAVINSDMGNDDVSLENFEEALGKLKATLGKDHPSTLTSMRNLAAACFRLKENDRAFELLEENVKLTEGKLTSNHPDTISAIQSLGSLYSNLGRYKEAIVQRKRLVEIRQSKLGADDPMTLEAMADLGDCYSYDGQYKLAIETLEPILIPENTSLDLPYYRSTLRYCYAHEGRLPEFQAMASEDLAGYREKYPTGSEKLPIKLSALGFECLAAGDYPLAELLMQEALEDWNKAKLDNERTANCKSQLGAALSKLGKLDEAEEFLEAGYQGVVEHELSTHPKVRADRLINAAQRLISFYEKTDRPSEAQQVGNELEEIRERYGR